MNINMMRMGWRGDRLGNETRRVFDVSVWRFSRRSAFRRFSRSGLFHPVGAGSPVVTHFFAINRSRFDVFSTGAEISDHPDAITS